MSVAKIRISVPVEYFDRFMLAVREYVDEEKDKDGNLIDPHERVERATWEGRLLHGD